MILGNRIDSAGMTRAQRGSMGKQLKICQLLIATVYYTMKLNVFVFTVISILRPHSPEFLTSVLCETGTCSIAERVVSSTFTAYVVTCLGQIVSLFCGPISLFMFSLPKILEAEA